MQWPVVSTLCQEMKNHLTRKLGFEGTQKIRPVLEIATCWLQGKYGVEISIVSMNKDNTHPWVRIYHGSNRFVMNLNNNETELPEVQLEEYALRLNAGDFASRSKAKAKPQRREPAGSSTGTIPIGERTWTDVESGEYSLSDYPVSKKLIHLLRHGSLPREDDGAIEFWRTKDYLQKYFCIVIIGLMKSGKAAWQEEEGTRKDFNIVLIRQEQGHSGCSLIDPTLQDKVVIPSDFFQYIYHVGCAINLHSIINSGLIPGGQNLSNRQTVFFLSVDPMDKQHKDLETIDLNAPRLAQYMHKAWKKHQNTVYWVDINLDLKKGLKFYQTRSNAIILYDTFPSYCIPKVVRMETGAVIYRKSVCVISGSSKEFLET